MTSNQLYPPIITNEAVFNGALRFTRGPLHISRFYEMSGGSPPHPHDVPTRPTKPPKKKKPKK